jgi:hypothetical protein
MIGAPAEGVGEQADEQRSHKIPKIPARLLHLAYSFAAVSLTLKNAPALRLISVVVAMILSVATLLSSGHLNRASLVWGTMLLAVNIFQLLLILWDLRPVTLQGDARLLHDLIYSNLSVSSFNRLMRIADWYDGSPGDMLASQGARVTEIIVLVEGSAEVERDGHRLAMMGPGTIIGEIGALSARPFSSTIRLTERSRYVAWRKAALDDFFACHPSIASGFERAFISRLDPTQTFHLHPGSQEFTADQRRQGETSSEE